MTSLHFLQTVAALITVAALAFLNRAAGNRLFGFCRRGKPAVYMAPVVGLIAMCWQPWPQALAWAGAYLAWRVWPHGRWIDLENDPTDPQRAGEAMDLFEAIITRWSFGSDLIALFWRHLTLWPGLAVVWLAGGPVWLAWIGIPAAVAFAGCHAFAKRLFPNDFHWFAEGLHGALFGLIMAASA